MFPRVIASVLALVCGLGIRARADSTVVFNEIMYHPRYDEPLLEWIELHNQMAVDMDLSGWSLSNGVGFTFPDGTVVAGGGYLVVAVSPPDLAAAAGVTNVFGPFTDRLSNNGEKLELRNRNGRVMDAMEYGPEGYWPVAPDGIGPSLAKQDETAASAPAANWTWSAQTGGTPGACNFPPARAIQTTALSWTSTWAYFGADPGSAWQNPAFDDSGWSSGAGLFAAGAPTLPSGDPAPIPTLFNSGIGVDGRALAAGASDPHYLLTASAQGPPTDVGATVMANHPNWLANNSNSMWIGAVNSGTINIAAGGYAFRTSFDLTGFDPASVHLALQAAVDNNLTNLLVNGVPDGWTHDSFAAFSSVHIVTNGFTAGTNTLDFLVVNGGTSANPGGLRILASGTARPNLPVSTPLPSGPATRYFRARFVSAGDAAATGLRLRTAVDDGAVFYLNGTEVLRLNMPAGAISDATPALTNGSAAGLAGPFDLPADALTTGTNVLAVEVHPAAGGTPDALFGAELILSVTNVPPPPPPLALNELPNVTNAVFWIELVNHGTQAVDLANFVFGRYKSDDNEKVLPAQVIPAGGRYVLTPGVLGFGADPGDPLVLFTPGRRRVIDAIVAKRHPRGRWPDATGPWLSEAEGMETPGETNRIVLQDGIVINELMYHARDLPDPPHDSPESWLELHNRGTNAVDLTGWTLDGGIDFAFPAGRTLAPDAYLVIAKNADHLRVLHPGADILGNFTNRLSQAGERIVLRDPTGNPADEVHYRDAKPWPEMADGLGASLELRDPRADNANPAAWAASDESGRSAWQSFSYRGTATVEAAASPTVWKEFVLGLLGPGEVLVDDLSVLDSPAGARLQMLQNGTFETGADAWRIIGNHRRSEVIADPDDGGNHVLRLVATGTTEHMHNHAETTFTGGMAVTNGREYEVSFRAKWVAGCPKLNTRFYFNRLARTTDLAVPARSGTPGVRNSRWAANIGPTCADLAHAPVTPPAGQPVAVTACISDPDGVATAQVFYAVNGGAWQSVPLPRRAAGGDNEYEGVLPGQAAGNLVQFYVRAVDGHGAEAFLPAGGQDSRALYRVDTGAARRPQLHALRLLLTPDDIAWMHAPTNVMSNDRLSCTLVSDETTVFYDAGVHLQGSERGRNVSSRVGFTVYLPSDHLFRGVQPRITIDRSGGYSGKGGDHDEILLKHAVNRGGGLPGMYDDLVQFFAPRAADDGTGLLIMAKYGGGFLDSSFRDGSDGELYKLELIYYPTTTADGDAESAKLPQPDSVLDTDLKDLGDRADDYRWTLLKENHTERDRYAPLIALAKALSKTGGELETASRAVMDVDEWMRAVAFITLTGAKDIYTYDHSHNLLVYVRPEDQKAMAFPWDFDYAFVAATNAVFPGTGSPNTLRLIQLPGNLRAYYSHLFDLCDTTGDATHMGAWAARYAGLLGEDWSAAVTYLKARADYVRSRLPTASPFRIDSNGGASFAVSNTFVTLSGIAPIAVEQIEINGVPQPVTWTGVSNWTLRVPLTAYVNPVALQGFARNGTLLTNALASITVTNLGAPAPLPVVINEWMASAAGPAGLPDPVDGLFQDWFELYNPNDAPVDLSGYTLTDQLALPAQWTVPTNTVVPARGFLLVWADEDELQNGTGTNGELHAAFKLGADGEAIGLFAPDGARQHAVTFGPQAPNISQGLFPDGRIDAVYAMTNWTPRRANQTNAPPAPELPGFVRASDSGVTLGLSGLPDRAYGIEYSLDLTSPNWTPVITNRAAAVLRFIEDPPSGATQRFYRARLLQ